MNWSKAIIAGVAAAIVMWLANFVMHVVILGNTYMKYPEVFSQEERSPFIFLLVGLFVAIFAAILFAKTRRCWADGWKGGMIFGFWLGMVAFFSNFYSPLVIDGFPYFLAWCWGGINVIGGLIGGAILGAIYKTA